LVLNIPYERKFQAATDLLPIHHTILTSAIRHQNIIGWDCFLKGYTSALWHTLAESISDSSMHNKKLLTTWDVQLKSMAIKLHKKI